MEVIRFEDYKNSLNQEPFVFKEETDMIDWTGEEWQNFFDSFCVPAAEMVGETPWNIFADFIHTINNIGKED